MAELGQHAIGGDVAATFAATSSIGATAGGLMGLISAVTVTTALLWCAWYLRRVFANGFNRSDVPYMATGVLLALALVFLVFTAIGIRPN